VNTKFNVRLLSIQYLYSRKWPEFSTDLHNSMENKSVIYAVYFFKHGRHNTNFNVHMK
jgi:hypothetical protein